MRWEELTAPQFAHAVETVRGVCVVPVGVIEKHGEHLPLGTDLFWGQRLADRAAELEPAIIFPPYYFGQINEAKHQPGTVAVNRRVMLDLLENICEEIARNGLRKIVLLSAHGGNRSFLPYFAEALLESERDYVVFLIRGQDRSASDDPQWQAMHETQVDQHAGESETGQMLAIRPELVRMDDLPDKPGDPLGRLAHLPGGYTGIWWYADFPDHYAGDGKYGTAEKGQFLLERQAEKVAAILRAIKQDTVTETLTKEFYSRTRHQ